jgi:PiT family inorganic phosphate transporter
MGLIMLILIGTVPTAYALNHAVKYKESQDFIAVSREAAETLQYGNLPTLVTDPRSDLTEYVRTGYSTRNTVPALRNLIQGIADDLAVYQSMAQVPPDRTRNFRNDMYLVSEALRILQQSGRLQISAAGWEILANYKRHVDYATRYIPVWVKVAVAIALGLGTMVGWKRIVITVGERIGKSHLTYAQGAAAEITAMATIGGADAFALPVSTTHVLSSGVAGAMAANHSGLQWGTVRNLLMAWLLTLPVSMILSALLFWFFLRVMR